MAKSFSPITQKLYNTSGISGYIYLMSILSGYPVGAKITSELIKNKQIDLGQAHRIICFTSTSGPLFILGTVAIGMFNNQIIGYIIIFSHFVGALLNGLLYRKYMITYPIQNVSPLNFNQKNLLEDIMYNSIKSILIVGGYVCMFFMIITILNHYNILYGLNAILCKIIPNLHISTINAITNGVIELTKGCLDLSALNLPLNIVTPMLSGLISFGGISIFLQAATFLKDAGINLKFYFKQKITHSIISVFISILLCSILI